MRRHSSLSFAATAATSAALFLTGCSGVVSVVNQPPVSPEPSLDLKGGSAVYIPKFGEEIVLNEIQGYRYTFNEGGILILCDYQEGKDCSDIGGQGVFIVANEGEDSVCAEMIGLSKDGKSASRPFGDGHELYDWLFHLSYDVADTLDFINGVAILPKGSQLTMDFGYQIQSVDLASN